MKFKIILVFFISIFSCYTFCSEPKLEKPKRIDVSRIFVDKYLPIFGSGLTLKTQQTICAEDDGKKLYYDVLYKLLGPNDTDGFPTACISLNTIQTEAFEVVSLLAIKKQTESKMETVYDVTIRKSTTHEEIRGHLKNLFKSLELDPTLD